MAKAGHELFSSENAVALIAVLFRQIRTAHIKINAANNNIGIGKYPDA